MLPLIPADPESESVERHRASAGLQALQARLPRLLFAAPRDDQGVAALTRLAKSINTFLEEAGNILREAGPSGPSKSAGVRPHADVRARIMVIAEDAEGLVGALDAFLADPDAEDRREALEENLHQAAGHLPDGSHAWQGPLTASGVESASASPPGGDSPFAPHPWRAAAERDAWWGAQLQQLRRQTRLALGMALLALFGVALGLFTDSGFLPGPETWPGPGSSDQDPGRTAAAPIAGAPAVGQDSHATGSIASEAQTPNQIPSRLAELELELLRLRGRLDALENQQEGTDRALVRLQNAAEAVSSRPID